MLCKLQFYVYLRHIYGVCYDLGPGPSRFDIGNQVTVYEMNSIIVKGLSS